ncbi:hypothetical protein HZC34_03995 [Candidatus Saganbacteria bacterium]|nr:hypothetical protein [Candidatus Saganbacteria bacterium]
MKPIGSIFCSPGGLVKGITIKNLGTKSRTRNPLIADLFYRADLAERIGSGIKRMGDLPIRWIAAFSISYFSHLILDIFNRRGSKMFWPDPGRDVIPRNPKFRSESGSKDELSADIFASHVRVKKTTIPRNRKEMT